MEEQLSTRGRDAGDWPLLERESELSRLAALVAGVARSEGGVLTLVGEAGTGKTTLVQACLESALAAQLSVHVAVGSDLEQSIPFGVAGRLLGAMTEALDSDDPLVARGERIIHSVPHQYPLPESGDDTAVVALHRLVSRAAEARPTLLVVDDLHWADDASLRVLNFLARRAAEGGFGLLMATRPLEGGAARALHATLLGAEGTQSLRLAPLTEAAVASLAEAALGAAPEPPLLQACMEAAGGNPFLLTALLSELRDAPGDPLSAVRDSPAPTAVRSRLIRWLAAQPEHAQRLAESLAVLEHAEIPLLAAHAGVTPAQARDAWDRLEQSGLVSPGTPLAWAHPLLARAARATLSAHQETEGHLRAARLLSERAASVDRIAAHLAAAAPTGEAWVAETLVRAGAEALLRGAPHEAVKYLSRALAEDALGPRRRAEVLLDLGTAQLRGHEEERAIATFTRGLTLAGEGDELTRKLALSLAAACHFAERTEEAMQALERARAVCADARDRQVIDGNAIALGLLDPAFVEDCRGRLADYRDQVEAGQEIDPALLVLLGAERVLRGEPAAAELVLVRRGIAAGLQVSGEQGFAFVWALSALESADAPLEALVEIDRALEIARAAADGSQIAYLLGHRTYLCLRGGRLAEAEAAGRAALHMRSFDEAHVPFPMSFIDCLIERDAVAEARDAIPEELPGAPAQHRAMLALMNAKLDIADGAADATTLQALLDAGAIFDGIGLMHPRFVPWRLLAAPLAADLGDHALAEALADAAAEIAESAGTPGIRAHARLVQARVRGDTGLAASAVELAVDCDDSLLHVQCLVALGEGQLTDGDPLGARETLRTALARAHEIGARRMAEVARRALVAAGGRPRRYAISGRAALTPAELEVARLAAGGLPNRDIADALFLALKTVERHLARSFAKLGISGRAELAAALAGP